MAEKIKILLFGILVEKIGSNELFFPIYADSNSLLSDLNLKYPAINDMSFSIAINGELISHNTIINNNDEIALLPPFSGG